MIHLLRHFSFLLCVLLLFASEAVAAQTQTPVKAQQPSASSSSQAIPAVTQTDVLALTKLVLEDAKEHVAQMHERFDTFTRNLTIIGAIIGGLLVFFGRREFKSWVQPL